MIQAFILRQWKYIAIAVLILVIAMMNGQARKDRSEISRITANNAVLYGNFKSYKTAYGKSVASVGQLTLRLNEFKANEPLLRKEIESLKINLRRVESVSQISINTEFRETLPLTSRIVVVDTVKCFAKKTEFIDLSGCYSKDSTDISLSVPITITPILHKVPRFTLFWIDFGIKEMRLDILCDNPYATITSAKIIEFSK